MFPLIVLGGAAIGLATAGAAKIFEDKTGIDLGDETLDLVNSVASFVKDETDTSKGESNRSDIEPQDYPAETVETDPMYENPNLLMWE